MAVSFTDDEATVILSLARPIEAGLRPQFIDAVRAELEAAGLSGTGAVHRIARVLQRRYFNPPEFPNQSAPVHRGSVRAA
jgi:hypothetical protein